MVRIDGSYPKITFIIPTYNASFHLERCLKSIRGQDYPGDKIEVIVADGGSSDNTLDITREYGGKIIQNHKKLAEYGLQLGMLSATGEFLVPFAADNGLIGRDWAAKVVKVFARNNDISAVWGRLAAGKDDSSLNKYFELIQSDPLNWFLNKNLLRYKKTALKQGDWFIFNVEPQRPLVWGANGLVYRAQNVKSVWVREGYFGDNDAFQQMIMQGDNKVAYFDRPFVYHHHVARISDWIKKWKRNYKLHFLSKLETRNLGWVFSGGFKARLLLWLPYSLCPLFSGIHSIYLALRQRSIYWFYHPWVSFLQTAVYLYITLTDVKGRVFFRGVLFNNLPLKR